MSKSAKWREKTTLERMYNERMLSTHQIASELGCSQKTVCRWMDKHGIERRDRIEATARKNRRGPARFRTDEFGYESWWVRAGDDRYKVRVHRLLATLKYGLDSIQGKEVHHKNGVPWDNRQENIELVTSQEHFERHPPERDSKGRITDNQLDTGVPP